MTGIEITIEHPTDRPNFSVVTIDDPTRGDQIRCFFSYRTLVAYYRTGRGLTVQRNVWSATTGRHLNHIDGGSATAKAARVPADVFAAILETELTEPRSDRIATYLDGR